MKISEIGSDKLIFVDRAEARWLLGAFLIVIGISAVTFQNFLSTQNVELKTLISIVLVGIFFFLLGILILITTRIIICEIDKSIGLMRIKNLSLKGKNTSNIYISQIKDIEVKELTSIHYYVYKINFVVGSHKRVSLTFHPSSDRTEIELLGTRVARFLNKRITFSGAHDPLYLLPYF